MSVVLFWFREVILWGVLSCTLACVLLLKEKCKKCVYIYTHINDAGAISHPCFDFFHKLFDIKVFKIIFRHQNGTSCLSPISISFGKF